MHTVGIAMGTNLGDRLSQLQQAREHLHTILPVGSIIRSAPVYLTPPINCPEGAPDFYNTVVEMPYYSTPQELLNTTQDIEIQLGRITKSAGNQPRPIDLDILYFGSQSVQDSNLQIPHPRITLRRFVLEPLAELRPDLILPDQTKTIADILADSQEPPLTLVSSNW